MFCLPTIICSSMLWFCAVDPALSSAPQVIEVDQEVEDALRNDPSVRLAQANLEKARAELVAARYAATLRILEQRQQLVELQRRRDITREAYQRTRVHVENGTTTQGELAKMELELLQVEGQLQSLQLRIRPHVESLTLDDVTEVNAEPVLYARPVISKSMQEQLDLEVTFPNVELDLVAWVNHLSAASGATFLISNSLKHAPFGKVLLGAGSNFTVGNAMLALADQFELAFVQRDYGWILMPAARARELAGAAIPRDLPCTNASGDSKSGGQAVESLDDLGSGSGGKGAPRPGGR